MNVSLTPKLEKFVQKKVASGRYNSSSEVIRHALRLLEQQDEEYEQKLRAVREVAKEAARSASTPSEQDSLTQSTALARKRLAELREEAPRRRSDLIDWRAA